MSSRQGTIKDDRGPHLPTTRFAVADLCRKLLGMRTHPLQTRAVMLRAIRERPGLAQTLAVARECEAAEAGCRVVALLDKVGVASYLAPHGSDA